MNRISQWPLRQPSRTYRAPSILNQDLAPSSWRLPVLDVLALLLVLTLAAVLFLLLIWLSLDIVDPTTLRYEGP